MKITNKKRRRQPSPLRVEFYLNFAHKTFNTDEGFLDLAVRSRIGTTRESLTSKSKGVSRHNCYAFFLEKAVAEGFIIHPRDADLGEGIKSAFWFEGWQADLVKSADDQSSPPVIF